MLSTPTAIRSYGTEIRMLLLIVRVMEVSISMPRMILMVYTLIIKQLKTTLKKYHLILDRLKNQFTGENEFSNTVLIKK